MATCAHGVDSLARCGQCAIGDWPTDSRPVLDAALDRLGAIIEYRDGKAWQTAPFQTADVALAVEAARSVGAFKALLSELEWSGMLTGLKNDGGNHPDWTPACMICRSIRPLGHRPGCRFVAAMKSDGHDG